MIRWIKMAFGVVILLFLGLGVWRLLQSPLSRPAGTALVVLDPGHGGSAPGAVYEGVMEKDLNLAVALKAKTLLEAQPDMEVLMTREEDKDVALEARPMLSNEKGADLFVSIHANALEEDASFRGVLTFYHQDNQGGNRLASAIQRGVVAQTEGNDLGIREEDFAVTRLSEAPACLLEMGFMTNAEELSNLGDEAYQEKIAQGICDGILDYLERK